MVFLGFFLLVLASAQQPPANSTALSPGVVVSGTVVALEYDYFYVVIGNNTQPLTITCTPIADGDPDLFVSLTLPYPQQQTAEYVSNAYGSDGVTLPFLTYSGKPYAYIAVYGWRTADYTIVASFESVVNLVSGTPQGALVPKGTTDYFEYKAKTRTNVTFSVLALSGEVSVYISGTEQPQHDKPSTWQWSSGPHYSGEAIVVSASDPNFPSSLTFQIGVFGVANASYRIIASGGFDPILLSSGIPQNDHCETGESEYFIISVNNPGCSLTVTVTQITGDPDLYMSTTNDRPSPSNYTWKSTAYGSDQISINPATPATYYITALAYQNSSFTILANVLCSGEQAHDIILVDGMPQQGYLETGQTMYFTFFVTPDHEDVSVSVTRRFGDPNIYVRTDGRASPTNYTWKADFYGEDLLTIHVTDRNYCENCKYYIAIYAASNTSFTVTASLTDHHVRLQEGVPFREDLTQFKYEYFRFDVEAVTQELTVTVTPLGVGDPDLYISVGNNTFPNNVNYTWSAQRLYGDAITIPHTDPKACQFCTYWISVYAFSNTTFTIVATFDGAVRLQDSVPQSGHALRGAFAYYDFQTLGGVDVIFTLTTLNGSSSLYISNGDKYPETDSYGWYAPYYNQIKTITIPASDSRGCHNVSCTYKIGVQAIEDSDWSLVAYGGNGTVVLVPGVSQRGSAPAGGWLYFLTKVEETGKDLSIMVTPLTGDPDIYVSTTIERPNSTVGFYDKKATRYGSDSIDYENATIATYYIGINTYTNSTFNVLALLFDDNAPCTTLSCTITLFNGQPQEGVIHLSHYIYYYFVVSPGTGTVTFTLSKEYGDPDMYITNDGSFPNTTHKQWSSTSIQSDVIIIQNPTPGGYIIGIYAYQTSGYTLLASATSGNCRDSLVTLQNGVPIRGDCQAQQSLFYTLTVDDSESDLTVTVTTFSGDPDLYISTSVCPGTNGSLWNATAYRSDSVTIPTTDPHYCQCQYYVTVYCFMSSSFSIVSSFTQTQTLSDGIPQAGSVAVEAWQYYRLRAVNDITAVTVTLTPVAGNPDIYIQKDTKPTLTSSLWNSTDPYTGSIIVIRNDDPNFCDDCIYYAGVYGRSEANYTIRYDATHENGTSTTTIVLQNGVSTRQWVDTNQYQYFSFEVTTAGQDVTIVLTPLTGDPDLYVSSVNDRPNTTDFEYSSRGSGADAVAISNSNATTWYIAVYAYLNSTFTLTAYVHCSVCPPITLVNGIPQNGILNTGLYQYYRFFLSNSDREQKVLYISVTRTVGDPDIYVRNDGVMPTRDNKTWFSSSFGEDLIAIQNPVPGEYDIGVYAYQTTQYTILAKTDDIISTLLDGVPQQGALIQTQYQYFQIAVDRYYADLTVTVTSFNGDPDLFISTSPYPNASNAMWSARSPREDSITIPWSKLSLQTYYISVQAWTNCTFTIIASFNGEVLLQSGVPQGGAVGFEASYYYRFTVGANITDLYFSLTTFSGNAYMYISKTEPPVRTNMSTYDWWSSDPTSSGQYVSILATDPKACNISCTYYVNVYGHTAANYSLVAQLKGEILVLQDGIAQRQWVNTGEYAYFVFNLNLQKADLQIAITPLSGDPDLYISVTTQRPSTTNYTWKSIASGADAINIDFEDPNYVIGPYYVAIFGWQYSTFTIIATVIDLNETSSCDDPATCPYTVLQNGVPQVGFLNQSGDRLYYEFYVGDQQSVTFTVSPRYGDPDMYIRNDTVAPNATNALWSARSYGRDSITISDGCRNCRYLILIQAYSHTLYTLVASTDTTPTLLQNGVASGTQTLEIYQWKYYYVMVTSITSDPLVISITSFSGDPDLYISNTTTHPNTTEYQWKASAYGSDQVVINNPALGSYYIGVYAYHNTSFSIVATNGPISLVNGQPHSDQLDHDQFRDYQIFVSDPDRSDLVIALSVNQGDPLLYVGTLTNGTRPNPAEPWSYNWSTAVASSSSQRYTITVPAGDPRACYQCTYFIRVVGNTSIYDSGISIFSLTATYGSQSIVILIAGKPYSSTVEADKYVYFRAIVDSNYYDVNIGATTFIGDIDLFVSVTNPFPNRSDYNWSSIHDPSARGDSISISHTNANFVTGYYYIGVYGWNASQFTITLAANETMLSPGTAQVGVLSETGSAFFFVSVGALSDLTISMSSFNDSQTAMASYAVYVTTSNDKTLISHPNQTSYDWWQQVIEDGNPFFIARNCSSCTYYIGVYGTPGRTFSISASLEGTTDTLFAGRPFKSSVSSGALKYFQIYVTNGSSFSVLVETCTGNADLYMSQDSYKPDPEHYRYKSVNSDKNELIEVHDPAISNSEFYIGVQGAGSGTNEYIVTASTVPVVSTAPYIRAGAISVTASSGAIALEFAQAASNITPADLLIYTIYYATSGSPYVMYSACGLEKVPNQQRLSFSWRQTSNLLITKTIEGLLKDTIYKINVVVTDNLGQSTLYQAVNARTTSSDPTQSISLGLLLGILLPVAGVIVAVMIYLIVRNRKLTKILDFELHDTPKRALEKAAAGPKNYDKLLNEDDEETGTTPSTTYAPPPPASTESIQAL